MITSTFTDLLDCLRSGTIAAIIADVQASGDPALARYLAEGLGTLAPPAEPAAEIPPTGPIPPLQVLTLLTAPVPPMLEAAIDYDGDARWVGFYWEPAGDEASFDDGQISVCGANWGAYLGYTQHRAVWPHLALYDFGSSDEPARHWLVLDRCDRKLYAGPWQLASAFLRRQERPPVEGQEPRELPTAEELLAILRADLHLDPEDITAQIAEADQRYTEMSIWLDHYAEQNEEM